MANVKITSYVDHVQREQDAITTAQHTIAMQEAGKANGRLDRGVAGAEAARPDSLYKDLGAIATPPPQGPGIPGIQDRLDWVVSHLNILAEVVLALVQGHATGPKKEGEGDLSSH
jgi:hypothetical protein